MAEINLDAANQLLQGAYTVAPEDFKPATTLEEASARWDEVMKTIYKSSYRLHRLTHRMVEEGGEIVLYAGETRIGPLGDAQALDCAYWALSDSLSDEEKDIPEKILADGYDTRYLGDDDELVGLLTPYIKSGKLFVTGWISVDKMDCSVMLARREPGSKVRVTVSHVDFSEPPEIGDENYWTYSNLHGRSDDYAAEDTWNAVYTTYGKCLDAILDDVDAAVATAEEAGSGAWDEYSSIF